MLFRLVCLICIIQAGAFSILPNENNGGKFIDFNSLDLNDLKEHEFLDFQASVEPITFTWLRDKISLGFSYQLGLKSLFKYDKTIPEVLIQGNAPYIGQEVELGLDLLASFQHVYGVSVGYHLPYFAICGRLKYYSGIFNLETQNGDATLFTEEDTYHIRYQSNYRFLKSGDFLQYVNDEFLWDSDELFTSFLGKNFGLGADVGIKLDLSDQFNFSASILDLGTIRWRNSPKKWDASRNTTIEGVDLSKFLENRTIELNALSDTLASLLQLDVTEEKYNTSLPTRIYLGIQYDIHPQLTFGLLYAKEFNDIQIFPTIAAQLTTHIGEVFHFGAVYSTKHGRFTNLGLHTLLQLGPVQLYALTDNLFNFISFNTYGNWHLRAGINLQFNFNQ